MDKSPRRFVVGQRMIVANVRESGVHAPPTEILEKPRVTEHAFSAIVLGASVKNTASEFRIVSHGRVSPRRGRRTPYPPRLPVKHPRVAERFADPTYAAEKDGYPDIFVKSKSVAAAGRWVGLEQMAQCFHS